MNHNRRKFIKLLYAGLLGGLVLVWNWLTQKHIETQKEKARILPLNAHKPVSFHNDYIVLNDESGTRVLSSHCTHLGCKIHEFKNGKLICPCHGSEYDLKGTPTKGPAFKSLHDLKFKVSTDNTSIEIIA